MINYRNFKNYSSENFKSDLHTASWDEIDTSLTVDEAWDAFSTTLGNVIDQHVPLDTKRVRSSTLPWLTSEIRALMRSRDFHHKRAQKTQADREWRAYRNLRNKTTSFIRKSKRENIIHMSSMPIKRTLVNCGKLSSLPSQNRPRTPALDLLRLRVV